MHVIKVTGESLDELFNNFKQMLENMAQNEQNQISSPAPKAEDKKPVERVKPDISKVFWIDRVVDKKDSNKQITTFNVIAPFAISDTIKCSVKKIDGEDWIFLRYDNNDTIFGNCFMCNFTAKKTVEYKYNFHDHKVDRKKMKMTYGDDGVLRLSVASSKFETDDDFVIGLEGK